VIYGSDYWKKVINLQMLADKGAIAVKDLDLFKFADTPEAAFKILQDGLIENHLTGDVDERRSDESVPAGPEANAQELLGPDIAKTQ